MMQVRSKDEKVLDVLFKVYNINLDIWKTQVDNYFKRVQILQLTIEGALLAGFIAVFKEYALANQLLCVSIAIVGIYISFFLEEDGNTI